MIDYTMTKMNRREQISELYESYNKVLLRFTTILISTQIIHLIWLTYVATIPYFLFQEIWHLPENFIFAAIDYLEIPALILTSLFYIVNLSKKNILLLGAIFIQFIHIAWITDTFILENAHDIGLAIYIVILIDYSEIPVIIDFIKKSLKIWFLISSNKFACKTLIWFLVN